LSAHRREVATSAQHGVKPNMVGELRQAEGDQSLLRSAERSLRIKDAQVAVNSLIITGV